MITIAAIIFVNPHDGNDKFTIIQEPGQENINSDPGSETDKASVTSQEKPDHDQESINKSHNIENGQTSVNPEDLFERETKPATNDRSENSVEGSTKEVDETDETVSETFKNSWAVEPITSPVSEFTVNVSSLPQASHFKLYIEGTIIGQRVPIDDVVRSIDFMFEEPALLEVHFFESESSSNPLARASCEPSGELIIK